MKKFLVFAKKCILVALPFILVIAYTFILPMGYMDNEYPGRAYTKQVINGPADYNTLILGDSRAVADIFTLDISDAATLANGGATAIENYYYLRDYIARHGAPKKCIIGFAPFHYTQIDNFWNRTVYFNDLTIGEMCEVRKNARLIAQSEQEGSDKGIVITGGDTVDLISNRLRLPHVYMPALINSKFVGRYAENKNIYTQIRRAGGHQLYGTENGSSDLNYEVNYSSMDETADAKLIQKYLLMLLDLCRDNNIETYLISLPMNEASYEKLQESYALSLKMFLRSIRDMYPEIEVEIVQKEYKNEFFGDSSHLNEEGAKKFTKELKERYKL